MKRIVSVFLLVVIIALSLSGCIVVNVRQSSNDNTSSKSEKSQTEYVCPTCGGEKVVECRICKGKGGYMLKSYADGSDYFSTCIHCDGTGVEACPDCKLNPPPATDSGSFVNPYTTNDFNNIFSTPDMPCAYCNGTGQRVCTGCHGTGQIVKTNYSPDFGAGGNTYNTYTTCHTCNGKGIIKCVYCNGLG